MRIPILPPARRDPAPEPIDLGTPVETPTVRLRAPAADGVKLASFRPDIVGDVNRAKEALRKAAQLLTAIETHARNGQPQQAMAAYDKFENALNDAGMAANAAANAA